MEPSKKPSTLSSTSWAIALFLLVMVMVNLLRGGGFIVKDHSVKIEVGDLKLVKEEEKEIDGIDEIQLDLQNAEVIVQLVEDHKIHIKESTNDPQKDNLFEVRELGNKLVIERDIRDGNLFQFSHQKEHLVEVDLPKSFQKKLCVTTTSGNMDIKGDLNVKELQLESASGDINCNGAIKAEKFEIKTASGDQYFDEVEAEEVSCDSASGDINCGGAIKADEFEGETASGSQRYEEIEANQYSLEAASGDIEIAQMIGGGKVKSISGSVSLSEVNLKDDLEAESTSGEVEINFSKDSQAQVKMKTNSGMIKGNIEIEFKDAQKKKAEALIGQHSKYDVKVKTTSGDIEINQD